MKRFLTITITVATVVLAGASADASERSGRVTDCVTTTEMSRVAIGMTRGDAETVLDGSGRKDPENTNRRFAARIYRACGKPLTRQQVEVFYNRSTGRVDDVWRIVATDGTHLALR